MEKILTIFKNAENLSLPLKSFSTPSIPFELLATDYLYIGYTKYFRTFFIGYDVLNTNPAMVTYEYFNGAVWLPFEVFDDSYNSAKSGAVSFAPPIDWAATTVNGKELFYIRIKSDVDFSAGTKLAAISILFSNDSDIEGLRSDIVTKYNKGKSWAPKHEEARKQIIQRIRNAGHKVITSSTANSSIYFGNSKSISLDDITEFDILAPTELKEPSKHLAIALIYLNELTDAKDDKFERMGKYYMALYNEFMNLYVLKLDKNNNGVEDDAEVEGDTGTNLKWL